LAELMWLARRGPAGPCPQMHGELRRGGDPSEGCPSVRVRYFNIWGEERIRLATWPGAKPWRACSTGTYTR